MGVGEDCGPAVTVDVVNRPLFHDLQRVPGHRLLDKVVVIAVLDEEDAAVEDVDAVVVVLRPAGEDDAVAMGGTGVHRRAGRGDLEDSAVNVIGRQIDDGEVRFYRISNEQAPNGHLVVIIVAFTLVIVMAFLFVVVVGFTLVIVVCIGHGVLEWIDGLTKGDYLGLVCTGVVQQILQPFGLQVEADSQHEIRVSYPGNVASSRQECVWIGARRQQAEDLCPVSTYHPSPVSHKVGGRHDLDGRPGGRGSFSSSRGCRLGRRGSCCGLSGFGSRILNRLVRGDEGGVHDFRDLVGGELVADRVLDGAGNEVLNVAARKRAGEPGAHLCLDDPADLVGADALRHRIGNRGVDEAGELIRVDLRRGQRPEGLVDDRLHVGRGELVRRRPAYDGLDVRARQTRGLGGDGRRDRVRNELLNLSRAGALWLRGDGRRNRTLYLGGAGALRAGDRVLYQLGRVDLRLRIAAGNGEDQSRNRCDYGH